MVSDRKALRLATAIVLASAIACAALAQPSADPIGAVLEAPPAAPAPPAPPPPAPPIQAAADEDAAEAMATQPPAPVPTPIPFPPPAASAPPAPVAAPAPYIPTSPTPYVPAAPAPPLTYARPPQTAPYNPPPSPPRTYARPVTPSVTSPVHIDETGRTPDRPLNPYELGYDARLRASSASAQGMMGPLDGSWTLNVPGEGDVYVLVLVDRGGPLEGAWRDLRRIGALGASGFVEDIQRIGSSLTLRFAPVPGRELSVATLNPQVDGRWTGELEERGKRKSVILRRSN